MEMAHEDGTPVAAVGFGGEVEGLGCDVGGELREGSVEGLQGNPGGLGGGFGGIYL